MYLAHVVLADVVAQEVLLLSKVGTGRPSKFVSHLEPNLTPIGDSLGPFSDQIDSQNASGRHLEV